MKRMTFELIQKFVDLKSEVIDVITNFSSNISACYFSR